MSAHRSLATVLLLIAALMAPGCALLRDADARAARSALEAPESEPLRQLAIIFYDRLTNRRVDSIATYNDPGLREFFQTPEAFADYFADFVQALTENNFEAQRPTRVEMMGLTREIESDDVWLRLRFTGANGLPLRFWNTRFLRTDQWRRIDGRWWIIPGKV